MTYTERARKLRPVLEQAAQSLEDTLALTAPELFPSWDRLTGAGTSVPRGFRFRHGDRLYRTEQEQYTFVPHYRPGDLGTESLFSRVEEGHAGTLADPIPYEGNQELYEGLYYSQLGITWLCIRSSGQPLYHDLSALAGTYVQKVS